LSALAIPPVVTASAAALREPQPQLPSRFPIQSAFLSNNSPSTGPKHLPLEATRGTAGISSPFSKPCTDFADSALTGVVPLLEPLNPKFALRREVIQEQRHKAGHTVLTQKRAHEICHNGVSSCTDLRDHCCHEEGSQKKSLRFATPSLNSLSPHTDVYTIDSDSDSSIEQLTNRGNKLRKKARYVHEGQLAPPSGPQVYKRVRRHS
jgi:hypothetical protein